MKLKSLKPIFTLLLLTAIMTLPYFVFAQDANNGSVNTGSSANPIKILENIATGESGPYNKANENSLPTILGLVINGALSLLGVIFIILMVLAGYNWMTASGNEQRIEEAKDTIKRAIIGLVIVLGSWAIWNFILVNVIEIL
ncbi:MAG: pilin [Patescibacteria group bacterium]|nr:pilin [Patescibacteria group bacterium]